MTEPNLKCLYLIYFCDSLCFGLIMPILPTYILSVGGTNTILGLLSALQMVLQLLSGPLTRTCSEGLGKRFALITTMFIGEITYYVLGNALTPVSVIAVRSIFYLTNHTKTLCKEFVANNDGGERRKDVYFRMELLNVAAFVIGPTCGGIIYDIEHGFYYLCNISAGLSTFASLIAFFVPGETPETTPTETSSVLDKVGEGIQNAMCGLGNLQFSNHWQIVLVKLLLTISLSSFFRKFSMLLKIYYKATNTQIGLTIAYQNMLIFLFVMFVPATSRALCKGFRNIMLPTLCILSIGIVTTCHASTYHMYLGLFIPVGLAVSLLNYIWDQIDVGVGEDERISEPLDTLCKFIELVTVLAFGYACDLYVEDAVKYFSIYPLLAATFLEHISCLVT